jgi:hypothetical protein
VTAPNEASALRALKIVQSLSGAELDARIDAEVGPSMIGVFKALAMAMAPEGREDLIAQKVHLMVLAYLTRLSPFRAKSRVHSSQSTVDSSGVSDVPRSVGLRQESGCGLSTVDCQHECCARKGRNTSLMRGEVEA